MPQREIVATAELGAAVDRPRWLENLPFWGVHLVAVIGPWIVGVSGTAMAWLWGSYLVRMFAVTGVYHRYFSHRTYKTSRAMQLVLALMGVTAVQKGPLWWAAHHRHHHKHSDQPRDIHSPRQRGAWWAHVGWILSSRHTATDFGAVKDFARFPELRFVNAHEQWLVVAFAVATWLLGGWQGLVWGFFVSTVVLWHATFTINSLMHIWGKARYATGDDSKNHLLLAIVTLGEGWHNNHHYYQRSTRQGFYWWEVDVTYYVLRVLSWARLVWDLQAVPVHVRDGRLSPQRARLAATQAEVAPRVAQRAV